MEPLVGNTDGERPHPHRPPAVLHQQGQSVHPAAQPTAAAVDKVDAIILDMETDEVTAEDALEDEVVPGEDPDDVPGGEGDVQEEADLAGDLLLLGHGPDGVGRQHEVVVVDPDDGDVVRILISSQTDDEKCEGGGEFYLLKGCHGFNGFGSEPLVDVPVGHPVGLVKHRPVRHGVEERPEGGVAAAVVVQLEVLPEMREMRSCESTEQFSV